MLRPFPLENMKKVGYHNPIVSKKMLNNDRIGLKYTIVFPFFEVDSIPLQNIY